MADKKKRIMRAFKINEISAVDFPAQEGARMVIMKRDDKKKPKKGEPGYVAKSAFMTNDAPDGHSHLVVSVADKAGHTSWNGADNTEGHQHPWIELADGSIAIGASHGHGHTVLSNTIKMVLTAEQIEHLMSPDEETAKAAAVEKRQLAERGIAMENGSLPVKTAEDLALAFECSELWGDNPDAIRHIMKRATDLEVELPTEGDLGTLLKNARLANDDKENRAMSTKEMEKVAKGDETAEDKLAKAETKQAETEAELKVAKQLAGMTDVQKAHYEDLDPEAAVTFLNKSADEMDAAIAKSQEADKVIYTADDGTEYRKSDGARLAKMAKDRDADAKKLAKMEKATEDAAYTKRATEDFPHVPGTTEQTVAHLRVIDKMDDKDDREAALNTLRTTNTEMAKAFEEHGTAANPMAKSADDELDKLAKNYAKDNSVEFDEAYRHVLRTPEGSALYDQSTQH